MILSLLTLLAVTAWIVGRRGHRKTSWALGISTAALLCLTACGPLAHGLLAIVQVPATGPAFQVRDWPDRPAMVVLGAGITRLDSGARPTLPVWSASRVMRAAQLHAECAKVRSECLVFLSGGKAGADRIGEADLFAEQMQHLGVRKDNLVLERASDNTWQNVANTVPLLRRHNRNGRPIVLTSAIHAWRTALYFGEFGVEITPVATDYLEAQISIVPSAMNLALADLALHEIAGVARMRVYSALGLND